MRINHLLRIGIPSLLAIGAAACCAVAVGSYGTREGERDVGPWAVVERTDLHLRVMAGGDLQPMKERTVVCEVEDITEKEGLTVVSLVENGQPVKKGDVLCRLDSSQLDDLALNEEILLGQVRSECTQARLSKETAEIALREYVEGLVAQHCKDYEGKIALGKSDVQKYREHLEWTERMSAKGYASRAQLASERQTLAKAEHDLDKTTREYRLFLRFQVEKETVTLRGNIGIAESNLRGAEARLKLQEDRLAHIRKQIERCVIRAPQDGIAIHARRGFFRRNPLQEGSTVYEGQELFKLPDLTRMEAEVSLNESMGPQVKVGMPAEVRVASLGERILPGKVVSVTPLSDVNWKEDDERIRHFIVRVRLDDTPPKMLPLMSATVEIDTGTVEDCLTIPVAAMGMRGREQFCYVLGPSAPERRVITTRRSTAELIEVTGGLAEGEHVLLTPPVEPQVGRLGASPGGSDGAEGGRT
ncbi:multidrug resistance protein MdtN [Aquisphaera giovannonii]|uniref:Multidrug resistance protein MdtN n=1 Tax=Aquisphaera giovannonii TaxID=406548 RepID=A0A5B9W8D6_9BACT|nr:efflux RND transporter periplasmic adaptor subunit [Aquisphaera giovannonii]QEH36956.1 multidrug resistance protein MdtN [Aquisphaera giovannonii]